MSSTTKYLSTILIALVSMACANAQDYSAYTCPVQQNGRTLHFPFTGGFNAPQFSKADMDGDGTLELFVFDRDGSVPMVFDYDGEGGRSTDYNYNPAYKQLLPDSLVNWALLRDYNQDGLADLFVAVTYGGLPSIQLYEAQFDQSGELKYKLRRMGKEGANVDLIYYEQPDGRWINLTCPFTDIPEIIDVDGDGDLDVLSFSIGGKYVTYYRNIQVEEDLPKDTLLFEVGDRCFGKFSEAGTNATINISDSASECHSKFKFDPVIKGGGAHAGSTIMAFDADGDSDLELVIGDLSSSSLNYLTNGGSNQDNYMTAVTENFPDYNLPVNMDIWLSSFNVDINGDGFKDFIASVNSVGKVQNRNNIQYYQNDGSDTTRFEFVQKDFLIDETIDVGSFSAPLFIDENQDGLMDILVASGGYYNNVESDIPFISLYRNIGTTKNPVFKLEDSDYLDYFALNISDISEPSLTKGDLDNDGDIDLIVGLANGTLQYLENKAGAGNPMRFARPISEYMQIDIGSKARPALVDINQDGLLDLIVGEQSLNANNQDPTKTTFGSVSYFQNIGLSDSPLFSNNLALAPNNPALGQMQTKILVGQNSETVSTAPTAIMVNNELQILLGSHKGWIKRYAANLNDLSGQWEVVDSIVGQIKEGTRIIPTAYDIDDDGYLEMLIGNARGGLSFYNTDISSEPSSSADLITDNGRVTLFPNPAEETIFLELNEIIAQRLYISDSKGQYVKEIQPMETELDIKDLLPSIYYLNIITKEGRLTKRFVKI